jgi:predicted AlkP superfamily phosphohydrolase/phosphomutase/tetratricopeptide (TPR) repeat protein
MERLARKVLLVGWDAADWKVISPLMDAGHLPALQRLVERGVMGNVATLDPPFSPMLWTSIATGKTADQHGILHFTQPDASGQGVRPVLGSSRKAKAFWTILSEQGLHVNVVGWWPSHPAEPVHGVTVSNFYQRASAPAHLDWPLPPGTVHPPELADTLAALRVHPAELTAAHLLPFLPRLDEIDQAEDRRPLSVAKIVADAASIQAAATFLMEETAWDLTAVYFDAIDHFGHGFMKYHPPRQEHIPERDFALYKDVVTAGYRFHDMMLDRLLALAGEDTTVILLSDHGFHSDHLRPKAIPKVPAGPAVEHRPFGVLCMAGPGLRRDARIYGAGLLNVTPTLLTLFGLPVGRDMPAPPLVQAFETPPAVETIPTWETPAEDAARAAPADPWAEQVVLRQLVELGYVEAPEGNPAEVAEASARESRFNLARVYFSTGRAEQAIPLFEEAYAADSKHRAHYGLWLAHAYRAVGRAEEAHDLAARLRAEGATRPAALDLLLVDLHLDAGRADEALALLDAQEAPAAPEMLLRRADAFLRLGRYDDAEAAFDAALGLDPDSARAWHGLAKAHIGRKQYEPAAEAALAAVARLYHYPEAHFHLGVAMTRLGWAERAEQAFRVALAQRPGFALAHRWLARLYRDYLRDAEQAAFHWARYRQAAGAAKETDTPRS